MWKFLMGLPAELSVTVLILGIIGMVIIALKGHIKAALGKKTIEIGNDSDHPETPTPGIPPSTVTIIQKRTCGDCILLLMGEREKFELQMRQEANKILRGQMSYAERKLLEIQNRYMRVIVESIHKYCEKTPGAIDEAIQYKLVYGLLKDVTVNIKDEIRRSYKDNGFYDADPTEFQAYIRDRMSIITSVINQYIRNIYPERVGLVSPSDILAVIENENNFLSTVFTDMYTHARTIKSESDERIANLKEEFSDWVDEFIKQP